MARKGTNITDAMLEVAVDALDIVDENVSQNGDKDILDELDDSNLEDNSEEESDGDVEEEDSEDDLEDDSEDLDEDSEDDKSEKKFAGMYSTVEELENGYKSIQTAYQGLKDAVNKQSEADIVTMLGGNAPQEPTKLKLTDLDPKMIEQAMKENPQETLKLLSNAAMAEAQARMKPENAKQEVENFRASHKDFSTYSARMNAILKENPQMIGLSNRLDLAYKLAKAESAEDASKKALNNGVKKGYENAMKKGKAKATQGGKSGKSTTKQPSTAEDMILGDIMSEAKKRNSIIF